MNHRLFWDERYRDFEHLYSAQANEYLRRVFDANRTSFQGKRAFVPADGDGRNGLWLAEQGMIVDAFDFSCRAVDKANQRASAKNLTYQSHAKEWTEALCEINSYAFIAVIYFHLPKSEQSTFWQRLLLSLKEGGNLLVEVFHQDQVGFSSGGPKDTDFLYSIQDFTNFRQSFEEFHLQNERIVLDEGPFHQGEASVIRLFAKNKR